MKNGQLKPAYNVQHGVDSEYITWLTVGPQPTDTNTLIPFLKSMEENLNFKYLKIVADAGYESEENYSFIDRNNQISFIKPANYGISKSRNLKQGMRVKKQFMSVRTVVTATIKVVVLRGIIQRHL